MKTMLISRWMTAMLLIGAIDTILPVGAQAQSGYRLEVESRPYVELVGATEIPIDYGDSLYTLELSGESFTCFDRRYDLGPDALFSIGGHGFLRFDDTSTATIIDGFFTTLAERDSTSRISYRLDGEPGDRIMKVEWRNAGFAQGTADDSMNFQVWLYGRSGIIEIHIGPGAVGSQAAFNGGPWLGTFMAVPTFTKALAKCWIYGDPVAPKLDSLKTLNFRRLESAPSSGTVYRLVPSGNGASSVGTHGRDDGDGRMDLTVKESR